jgi:DNA repair photolyase
MKRYTGHREEWGEFVDVKVNAANLLRQEIEKKEVGRVWISGTCDPYQPLEMKYQLTKRCLEVFSEHNWPVTVQTKSPLVYRDVELLKKMSGVEVGLSIATADESVRKVFEPNAPAIDQRVETLRKLKLAGVKTFAMIAPLLPKAEGLVAQLTGKVDYVLIDKMNYHYADWVYRKLGLEDSMTKVCFGFKGKELADAFEKERIPYRILF